MTDLQKLIKTALELSQNLEQAASEEKRFCVDLQLRFEQMSYEALRMSDELQEIKSCI